VLISVHPWFFPVGVASRICDKLANCRSFRLPLSNCFHRRKVYTGSMNKLIFTVCLAAAFIMPPVDVMAQVRKGTTRRISTLRIGADKMTRDECISLARGNSFHKNLSAAKLDGADLSNVNLISANLSHAVLKRTIFTDAIMIRADLSNANLEGATLRGADLTGATLYNAILKNASLMGAILANAVMVGADLTKADLTDADLTGADLTGAVLKDAIFTGAKLENAMLPTGFKLPEEKPPVSDKDNKDKEKVAEKAKDKK
jgi:uncharacterized protein YjbI with pentapeptide repeats